MAVVHPHSFAARQAGLAKIHRGYSFKYKCQCNYKKGHFIRVSKVHYDEYVQVSINNHRSTVEKRGFVIPLLFRSPNVSGMK